MAIKKSDRKFATSECIYCHADAVYGKWMSPVFVEIDGREYLCQERRCEECKNNWFDYYAYHSTHKEWVQND